MYLSRVVIENFRGIEKLEVNFNNKINIIIGENATFKSNLVDAIRVLYCIGNFEQKFKIVDDDFHRKNNNGQIVESNVMTFCYEFRGLTDEQKGAFYEWLCIGQTEAEDYAKVNIRVEKRKDNYPKTEISVGDSPNQKLTYETFEYLLHTYLEPLRDSSKELQSFKNNKLVKVIKRLIEKNNKSDDYNDLLKQTNQTLLAKDEVKETKRLINKNIKNILKYSEESLISLRIDDSKKIENIVNIIKPFLPFDISQNTDEGLKLEYNSLGYNNLVYIATALTEITGILQLDEISHNVMIIEEPEAHLHPQLQICLYNFLNLANDNENSQLFVTTHSPTLTSKVPIDHLILCRKKLPSINIGNCFTDRENENIFHNGKALKNKDFSNMKSQLERYLDVTKSQLFFARGLIFVEGICEALLIPVFAKVINKDIDDFGIELVNIDGTSFYPFLHLFNSINTTKKIEHKISIITDDDKFPDSKKSKYSIANLINDPTLIVELHDNISQAQISTRIPNIRSILSTTTNSLIETAYKTFEYEIVLSNIGDRKDIIFDNILTQYIKTEYFDQDICNSLDTLLATIQGNDLDIIARHKITILFWKSLSDKAIFAQDFSIFLIEELNKSHKANIPLKFNVPLYIVNAINFVTS